MPYTHLSGLLLCKSDTIILRFYYVAKIISSLLILLIYEIFPGVERDRACSESSICGPVSNGMSQLHLCQVTTKIQSRAYKVA